MLKWTLCLLAVLCLPGCQRKPSQIPAPSAENADSHIIIGISPDYPPYDSLNPDGSITGFDYEMGEWLFEWMNENGYSFTHEWRQLNVDTILSAIQVDQVDLGISGFSYDPKREVLFSDPYYESFEVALVNADSDMTSVADLKGKHVAAQLGTTAEKCAQAIEGARVSSMQDLGIIVEALKGGTFDAVIMEHPVAENYLRGDVYRVLDGTLLEEHNYIIAKEGNTELMDAVNRAIKAFLDSPDYRRIKENYGL